MRILVIDHPREGVTLDDYAPHLLNETKHAWEGIKSGLVRDIYFRKDRPGIVIMMEAETLKQAQEACKTFPLAQAGVLNFECIPFDNYTLWENLFSPENKI
ncbi:superoxide dismutase [Aggregatibacter actinomycetemcomitans]|nr:superoxide dismutase [Aggregatibacter actinomycetemcomitans]